MGRKLVAVFNFGAKPDVGNQRDSSNGAFEGEGQLLCAYGSAIFNYPRVDDPRDKVLVEEGGRGSAIHRH